MIIELWFFLYVTTVIALAVSVYCVWELLEAKENGKQWIELNKRLLSELDQNKKTGSVNKGANTWVKK